MKILFACHAPTPEVTARYRRLAAAAGAGTSVTLFSTALNDGRRLAWPELDRRWRRRDPAVTTMHEALVEAAAGCRVLLHYNGVNLHPDVLPALPTFNVYCCFDDPESSARLSAPVAPMFDAAFYGNIASAPQYAAWGCRRAAHLPILVFPDDVPGPEARPRVPAARRDVDIVLCCGYSRWRRRRLDRLRQAFPRARCHGAGWPSGPLPAPRLGELYRRSRIGWNVHNSTGPINLRLFVLAAWGVMPLCDNRTGLGRLFELGGEAVGFDTIPEAIDLTRHYLAHEAERRAIARAAFDRFWTDYAAPAGWARLRGQIVAWMSEAEAAPASPPAATLRAPAPRPPRRPAPLDAAARRVRGAVGRALRRGAAHVERLRYGRAAGEHDERLYTGEPVDYVPGRRARSAPLARGLVPGGAPGDVHHAAALRWAMASLIGPARTILVYGEGAEAFAALVRVDPGRRVTVAGGAVAAGERPEVVVGLAVAADLAALDAFPGLAPRAPDARPRRLLLALRAPDTGAPAASDDIHARLGADFSEVRLAYMPDPYVPWLEPLDGGAEVLPLIAMCAGGGRSGRSANSERRRAVVTSAPGAAPGAALDAAEQANAPLSRSAYALGPGAVAARGIARV